MTDDTNNKKVQQTIFFICLFALLLGVIRIFNDGLADIFKFKVIMPQTSCRKGEPYILVMIFATIGLLLSGRNLIKIKRRHKN
ncbi:hypothetical protein DBR32_10100 [Taibaiella sp. KBW10]|nr:hypothetical protein DBR32_10100 [Taibaiella sp. KBW10]